ncbi:TIGR03089 family protein [Luteococcus peritonei]|uniref:TIGR03089 family protein n=1 Tax=Luteococcus peritonei TaxID=88874 RepID=A0ABW4RWY1_9ACTN
MRTPNDPVAALERRVASDGAQPLLTCYDTADGSRVEFSARTFANWVDKTANLIGSLGLEDGGDVALPLLLTHPGHWVSLVWTMAVWQSGGTVMALSRDELDRVELAVTGPQQSHPVPGVETVVCSLHPLGAGLQQPVAGVTDYAEVLSQPDVHWRNDPPETWLDDARSPRGAEALDAVGPSAARLLQVPGEDPWATVCDLLVAPLLGGGSTVVVRGEASLEELARIAADERATLL